mmetsp:Transcript_7275/g.10074  ORF Transcript_7275/g.10074 Transcript_7275/m.10074 type:complete len:145 (+) Transcript_7275:564-998(+)
MYLMACWITRKTWLLQHGLVSPRFKQFVSMADHIRRQLRIFVNGVDNNSLDSLARLDGRKELLNDWQINALRLLLVWTCDGNFLEMNPANKNASWNSIDILTPELNEAHLSALLRHSVATKRSSCQQHFVQTLEATKRQNQYNQ